MPHLFPIDRYLNVRAASSPSFSPDGRFVAYLSNTTGIPQAWLIPRAGREPVQLTFGSDAVREVHFSPERPELIFSMDAGGNERTQLYRLFGVGADRNHSIGDGWDFENLTNDPKAIHGFGGWSQDGTRIAFSANREDPGRFDVYVQEVASGGGNSGAPRLLAKGPGGYYSAVEWSPDDRFILVECVDSNVNQDLYIIEVATGEVRKLTPHEGDAQFKSPLWSHDGKAIHCITTISDLDSATKGYIDPGKCYRRVSEGKGSSDLPTKGYIDLASGCIYIWSLVPRHETETLRLSPDGRWLAVSENIDGRSKIHFINSGFHTEVTGLPVGVANGITFSSDGRMIAFGYDGPRHNSDVWIGLIEGNPWDEPIEVQPRQLTHSGRAGLPFSEFVEPELIHYKTFDGREIPAWWYAATEPGPVIVYPHGGPESQTRPNFSGLFQYFLARGYSILAPNVRGSSGYGTAFMNLDNTTKRMDSVADLAHAAYWLRDNKKGDPKRIAVYGGSYGGFMVLAAVTHYPELWAAGIDVVGICNFVTFLEQTGEWRRAHREKEYGNLREHREFLVGISPIHHADKIRCPLMVIHGANDPRVPVGEAEQIVAVLKARGVPVEYLRYEDEGHGLVKLKNRLDAYPKMAAFLDRYLKP